MKRELPKDPMMQQLISIAQNRTFSRRALFGGTLGTAAALTLTGCAAPTDIVWHNWTAYMDEDDEGNYPTLDRFRSQTGYLVDYKIEIDDNDTWFAKVKDALELGSYPGFDVACPTGWMASRMLSLGYLQQFDMANMPNKVAFMSPTYLGATDDPQRDFIIPWQAGFAGIGYDKQAYKDATGKDAPGSITDLWAAELKGRVGLLSEMRDSVGLVLMSQGIDISSSSSLTEDAFMSAIDVLEEQIKSGQIYNVRGNSYLEDLTSKNIIASTAWSGDITLINFEQGTEDNPEPYGFIFPDSGVTLWADFFVAPVASQAKSKVEELINYYYDPVNAAELALWVNYITPVSGAQDVAAAEDPELAENQLIFPNADTLAKSKAFRTLTGQEEKLFSSAWQNLLLGA
jgi:spermidine/putrescine transport system substrate-binding protein